jgi:hypothetical protein
MSVEAFPVEFHTRWAQARLLGHFPVKVRDGEQEQIQYWVKFEVTWPEGSVVSRREKHLVITDGLLTEWSERTGTNVLDDQELLGRLFELRFTAMDLGLSDLVVRPQDMQSIFQPAPQK